MTKSPKVLTTTTTTTTSINSNSAAILLPPPTNKVARLIGVIISGLWASGSQKLNSPYNIYGPMASPIVGYVVGHSFQVAINLIQKIVTRIQIGSVDKNIVYIESEILEAQNKNKPQGIIDAYQNILAEAEQKKIVLLKSLI